MRTRLFSLGLLITLLGGGCAYYRIQPVRPPDAAQWPALKDGYIFYQPELYFAATITPGPAAEKNNPGPTVVVAPIYLPNYEKPYRLTTRNFLAKADFAFEFENGWKLAKVSDRSDNTALASALADQLKTAWTVLAKTTAQTKTRVLLFHPEYDPQTGYFTGFAEPVELKIE